jgi:hypothetical protein
MLPHTHRPAAIATLFGAVAVLFFCALLAPSTARAVVITFEGHGDDGAAVQIQEGFVFTFTAAGWGIFTDGFVGGGAPYTHDGTTRLMASGDRGPTARVDFARTDAALFSLDGFDAATMFPGFRGRIEVTGDYGAGGSVSAFFDLSDSFTGFVLPATFAGLSTVHVIDTFSAAFRGDPGSFALDNIVYDQVPEPATLALLSLALAGVGFSRRRK